MVKASIKFGFVMLDGLLEGVWEEVTFWMITSRTLLRRMFTFMDETAVRASPLDLFILL